MFLISKWTPKQIIHMKREVVEHYADHNIKLPDEFKQFSMSTEMKNINVLKDVVSSIKDEQENMSQFVNDICTSIEQEYLLFNNDYRIKKI